jgi:hypothetical protein
LNKSNKGIEIILKAQGILQWQRFYRSKSIIRIKDQLQKVWRYSFSFHYTSSSYDIEQKILYEITNEREKKRKENRNVLHLFRNPRQGFMKDNKQYRDTFIFVHFYFFWQYILNEKISFVKLVFYIYYLEIEELFF